MKATADPETSKNTLGYSDQKRVDGYQQRVGNQDIRYIRRNESGKFLKRSIYGQFGKASFHGKLTGLRLDVVVLNRKLVEVPDFIEADKEWIDKIDRTQLSWDNW